MLFTISASGGGTLPIGTHKATFQGVVNSETSKGPSLTWSFQTEDGRTVSFFSDRKPTTGNKTGRWLGALSGKPLADGVSVNAADFVGKRYLLIVESNGEGGTKLNTFTAI